MSLNPFSDLYIKTSTPYSGDSVATEGQQRYEEKDPQHDEHQRQHSRSVLDGSRVTPQKFGLVLFKNFARN